MSFVALLGAIYLAAGEGALAALWVIYSVSLAWFGFVFVAIWRSASRYPGPQIWPRLARIGVCVGIGRMVIEAALLGQLSGAWHPFG